jgi:hypothetical protein
MDRKMKIESCKGSYNGNAESCLDWLEEMQPAIASMKIGGLSETLDVTNAWAEAMRIALVEMSAEIDGGEEEWQQYFNNDQLADVIAKPRIT